MNIKLCTETFHLNNPASLSTYAKQGGYEAWKNIVNNKISKREVISTIKDSALRV